MANSLISPQPDTPNMDSIKKNLGAVIKNLRLEAGLSQEQLAVRCGLKRPYLGIIERGGKAITVETAARLAYGLGVQLSSIFLRVEELNLNKETSSGITENKHH